MMEIQTHSSKTWTAKTQQNNREHAGLGVHNHIGGAFEDLLRRRLQGRRRFAIFFPDATRDFGGASVSFQRASHSAVKSRRTRLMGRDCTSSTSLNKS